MQKFPEYVLSQAVMTIKAARMWIMAALLIYCAAAAVAWSQSEHFDFMEAQFGTLIEQFEGLGAWEFILRIFVHNLIASYLAMCFVVFFGVVPLALAAFNGLMLGWFIDWMDHFSGLDLLLMLGPHGVFELPAMFIAFGVGMWRGAGFRLDQEQPGWVERLKRVHCVFAVFVVPLLFVAAILEGRYHLLELLM